MKQIYDRPVISVVIPVLNEGENIRGLIGALLQHGNDIPIEIIVSEGDPDGSTIKLIKELPVKTVMSIRGRGAQMNRGAREAEGDIILFLHADTRLPKGAFSLITEAIADKRYSAGAFDLGIDSRRISLRLTAFMASIKHRITRVPYGDQAIFIRSEVFRDTGGFHESPLFEDVDLMRRLKRLKHRIIILKQAAMTSPRKWEKEGVLYTILRNWLLEALYLFGVSPERLVKYYYREK